ncbi:uncharacterized protein LOC120666465 isoform X1 [Panicum virgatum]|uniref:uncharacterized protein LOC120666465 isoform X1 n=1 Tax=Panicum virgatum TaxID=38727 RepID=UPI0019D51D85|nr:uncharacterized protein LOC120666465 isoform X1 [Panicum virgatum]
MCDHRFGLFGSPTFLLRTGPMELCPSHATVSLSGFLVVWPSASAAPPPPAPVRHLQFLPFFRKLRSLLFFCVLLRIHPPPLCCALGGWGRLDLPVATYFCLLSCSSMGHHRQGPLLSIGATCCLK